MADVIRDPRVLLAACLLHPLPLSLATAIKEVLATAPQQRAEPVQEVECPSCEELGYVPLSEDGKSVFIDGIGLVPLVQQAEPVQEPVQRKPATGAASCVPSPSFQMNAQAESVQPWEADAFYAAINCAVKHVRQDLKVKTVTMRLPERDIALPIIDAYGGHVLVGPVPILQQRKPLTEEEIDGLMQSIGLVTPSHPRNIGAAASARRRIARAVEAMLAAREAK